MLKPLILIDLIKINFKLRYSALIKPTIQNIVVRKTVYYYKPIIADRIVAKRLSKFNLFY
jgi:hypothetical protein